MQSAQVSFDLRIIHTQVAMSEVADPVPTERILRRNRPGTKAADWCKWPEMKFEEMDSTLSVQQYIQQTIRKDPADIDAILTPPKGQDEAVWKCEHLRQFCMELNGLAVMLLNECDPTVCTQMAATEQWIYLCAAHKSPRECTAIDYIRHTLDGAVSLLNNSKYFPSRISIKENAVAKLASICRRVYRIFSHAYFNHKAVFDQFEASTHLCKRFTNFVVRFNLMQLEHLIIPNFDVGVTSASSHAGDGPTCQTTEGTLNDTIVTGTV
ncbi:Mob1/phocein family protein [Trichuris suis]|nr:Mob1/phocein family protein [Trichuris suis]